eukprot:470953-Prorocentrum_minimum.AAC.1
MSNTSPCHNSTACITSCVTSSYYVRHVRRITYDRTSSAGEGFAVDQSEAQHGHVPSVKNSPC